MTVHHRDSDSIFEGFFPFVSLLDTCSSLSFWNLFFLITFFFWPFFPSDAFPLPRWLSVGNTPFSASWASFVWSQTKALHHCPCCVGAYTVGSCHAKYEHVTELPWGSFPFQSFSLCFSKAVVSNVYPPVFSPQLLHYFNFTLNQNTLFGLGSKVRQDMLIEEYHFLLKLGPKTSLYTGIIQNLGSLEPRSLFQSHSISFHFQKKKKQSLWCSFCNRSYRWVRKISTSPFSVRRMQKVFEVFLSFPHSKLSFTEELV